MWCCLQVRVRTNDANGCYLDEANGCKFVFAGAKFSIVAGFAVCGVAQYVQGNVMTFVGLQM